MRTNRSFYHKEYEGCPIWFKGDEYHMTGEMLDLHGDLWAIAEGHGKTIHITADNAYRQWEWNIFHGGKGG